MPLSVSNDLYGIPASVPTTKEGLPNMTSNVAKDFVAKQRDLFAKGVIIDLQPWVPLNRDGTLNKQKTVGREFARAFIYKLDGTLDKRFNTSKRLMAYYAGRPLAVAASSTRFSGIPTDVPTTKSGRPNLQCKAARNFVTEQRDRFAQGMIDRPPWVPLTAAGNIDTRNAIGRLFASVQEVQPPLPPPPTTVELPASEEDEDDDNDNELGIVERTGQNPAATASPSQLPGLAQQKEPMSASGIVAEANAQAPPPEVGQDFDTARERKLGMAAPMKSKKNLLHMRRKLIRIVKRARNRLNRNPTARRNFSKVVAAAVAAAISGEAATAEAFEANIVNLVDSAIDVEEPNRQEMELHTSSLRGKRKLEDRDKYEEPPEKKKSLNRGEKRKNVAGGRNGTKRQKFDN